MSAATVQGNVATCALPGCGVTISRDHNRRFCCTEHRRKNEVLTRVRPPQAPRRTLRDCDHCGTEYLRAKNTRYCSDRCRLLAKLDTSEDCWSWLGTIDHFGYGTFWYDGQNLGAHRVAYSLLRGPIPDGLTLDHLCRNPPCVNPDHLEPVTQAENNRRALAAKAAALAEVAPGGETDG